jgi:hypothetical protein
MIIDPKQNQNIPEDLKPIIDLYFKNIEAIAKLMGEGGFLGVFLGMQTITDYFKQAYKAGENHALSIKEEIIKMN